MKIYQTDFSDTTGNCHQAAVATVFGLELADVPHFITKEDWRVSYLDFMQSIGFGVLSVPIKSSDHLELFLRINRRMSSVCLLAVRSFKYPKKGHCVVGYIQNEHLYITHDPNPENARRDKGELHIAGRAGGEYEIWTIDLFHKIESAATPLQTNELDALEKRRSELNNQMEFARRHGE